MSLGRVLLISDPGSVGSVVAVAAVLSLLGCSSSRLQYQKPWPDYVPSTGAASQHGGASSELGADATLDDYLRYAALHSPRLEASYHEWMAALEKVPQVKALPDPRLSYGYYFREVETRVGSQRQRLGASQRLPWFGKLDLRGDMAAQGGEEARQRFEAQKLRLFYRVKHAYAEYYYLGRAIDITRENIDLLTHWEKLARARYRVATGKHPDVIKAQVELGKLQDQSSALEDFRIPLVARLNEALGRETSQPLFLPENLPQERVVFRDEDLLGESALSNPELSALDATVAKEEQSIKLATKEYFPDLTFGVEWIETSPIAGQDLADNGKDPLIGTVSVNVPLWWRKYSAGVREAQARRRAAVHERANRGLELSTTLQLAVYKFRDAERKIALYSDGLIPKAREVLAANVTAYESGDASFLELLDAQRVFLEFHLSHERALANRMQRLAEIEMVVGKPLPRQEALAIVDDGEEGAP